MSDLLLAFKSFRLDRMQKGMVRIGEETYTENVILFRETIQGGWETNDIAQVGVEDLADLMAEKPEIVIFGTGWQPALPPRELVFAMARQGIGFETMDTPAACRTFNILVGEGRDVAAILPVHVGGHACGVI